MFNELVGKLYDKAVNEELAKEDRKPVNESKKRQKIKEDKVKEGLSRQAFDRMEGLVDQNERETLDLAAQEITIDLANDGFEDFEIIEYLNGIVSAAVNHTVANIHADRAAQHEERDGFVDQEPDVEEGKVPTDYGDEQKVIKDLTESDNKTPEQLCAEYFRLRWPESKKEGSYYNEWLERFKRGDEWAKSDYIGRKVLQKIAPDKYPDDVEAFESKKVEDSERSDESKKESKPVKTQKNERVKLTKKEK